jgi:AraC-like DNA-binding protein
MYSLQIGHCETRSRSALRSAITRPVTAETAATKMGLSRYATAQADYVQGFNSDFNEALKSAMLRVTSVSSCTWAVGRQELAHEYLNRPEMDVTEVAFLLGYEDSNSFYRAFRTWEGTTPSQLRAALRRSQIRQ